MKLDDRPIIAALLVVAFAGLCLTASNLIGEPIHPDSPDTIWIAVTGTFTVVLAISTIGLWIATYAAGKRADSVIRTAERAYVKMSHTRPGISFLRDGGIQVNIEVKNYGRTPTTVTDMVLQCVFVETGSGRQWPTKPPYHRGVDHAEAKAFLVTDDHVFTPHSWPKEHFPEAFLDKVRAGTGSLCVFGYVDYTDAFNAKQRGGYGRWFDWRRDIRPDGIGDLEWSQRTNLAYIQSDAYNYDVSLDDAD
jgi:hypothetical protein